PAGQGMLRQLLHRTKKIGLYFRGVTALHSPGLVKLLMENSLSLHPAKELCYWQMLYQQPVYMPLHRGMPALGAKPAFSRPSLFEREERHRCDPRAAKHEEARQPPADSEQYTGSGRT